MSVEKKLSFDEDELKLVWRVIFATEAWSDQKLDEAARGYANGACDDPWPVGLKFWIEIKRQEFKDQQSETRFKNEIWEIFVNGGSLIENLFLSPELGNAEMWDKHLKFIKVQDGFS